MGVLELREELQKYIEEGDKNLLDVLYKTAKSYIEQNQLDEMIVEGEDDIASNRVHSQGDVQKMIEDWTKE
ncbi:hypothetical protein [Joostella sp.]|uniref:hypothetical protein n=1 Tax=Joostella sp. TaxID=2231138 RepID=UPI003A9076F0